MGKKRNLLVETELVKIWNGISENLKRKNAPSTRIANKYKTKSLFIPQNISNNKKHLRY